VVHRLLKLPPLFVNLNRHLLALSGLSAINPIDDWNYPVVIGSEKELMACIMF
jgi:hypothetical protein